MDFCFDEFDSGSVLFDTIEKDSILNKDAEYQYWLEERRKETREKLMSLFDNAWEAE